MPVKKSPPKSSFHTSNVPLPTIACTEKSSPKMSAIHNAPRATTLPLVPLLACKSPMPTKPKANRWKVIVLNVTGVIVFQPVELGMPSQPAFRTKNPMMPPISEAGKRKVWKNFTFARMIVPIRRKRPVQPSAPR